MNEVWLAVSAVAGLVVAILAVWRIVVRATRSLRDEVKEEIRILRENDLRHLEKGIGALGARMTRSEERMTESLGQLGERVTRSEERTAIAFREIKADLKEMRAELRNTRAESRSDLKETRTELLAAIHGLANAAELAGPPVP